MIKNFEIIEFYLLTNGVTVVSEVGSIQNQIINILIQFAHVNMNKYVKIIHLLKNHKERKK